ncbi:insulinase family protein [Candidatus Poribacteria bacterium]|nr:insulinase family protein [Candidatus Poribacteria bacterium]
MSTKSIRIISGSLILCLIIFGSSSINAKPHDELIYEPIQFKPPVPQKHTLSNGMELYLIEDNELPVFDISGLVKTGTIYDPADKIGLASIFASVMRTGGTVSREPDALNEELESMAASVEIGMSPEYGSVSLSTLAEDIDKGLEIFADVLRNPAFREEKLDLRKQQAIEGIRRRNDNPIQLAWRNFSEILFGKDHPFGWYSEIETVESISVEDLKKFHSMYFHPNNIMLSITGDFETESLITKLENAFEGWEKSEIDIPDIKNVERERSSSVHYIHKELPQTTMLIGHIGIKRKPDFPDLFALRVMNDILGEGGFTSRLMSQVREKHGLAYMVGSMMQTSLYTNPGEFFAYSQTRAEKTSEAITLIIDIIQGMRDSPVSEEELNRTKDSLINSFVFSFESSSQIAFQQMMLDYRGFAPGFLETFTDNIAKVTAVDVQMVAQKYLHPDALTIVTVGNKENFDRPLDEFGDVNDIEIRLPEPPPIEPIPEASEADFIKAKEILAAVVNAHGGWEAIKDVTSVVSQGKAKFAQMGGIEMDIKVSSLYPDKLRQDMVTPQGNMSILFNGESAIMDSPMGSQPLPPEMVVSLKDVTFRDVIPLLQNLSNNDIPIQYSGSEELDENVVSVLLLTQPSGESLKIYVSNETNLILKYAFSETELGTSMDKETIFSDYRDVGGIQIAYNVIQNVNGEVYTESRLNSVEINVELNESLFETSQ